MMAASSSPPITSIEIPDFFLTKSTTSFPLEDSRIAEVAQALYLTTRCDFISSLKAFMVSTILSVFSTEILLERNTSVPKRMGTRTNERSEEHTSELQSRENLVCRLLLEKKKLIH